MIPIFIISYNRLAALEECLASIRRCIGTPYQIVIHDNGSTYGPLLEFLRGELYKGIIIEWGIENQPLYECIYSVTKRWMKCFDSHYFVVTDPDIVLNTPPDVLEFYSYILENTNVSCVGPHLIIQDIPEVYPLKSRVLAEHGPQFWAPVPKTITYRGREYCYTDRDCNNNPTLIDTTFGIYRRNYNMALGKPSIRTYPPYAARHLDWYTDPNNMTNDYRSYLWSANKYSHSPEIIKHWPKLI